MYVIFYANNYKHGNDENIWGYIQQIYLNLYRICT
jgi:hypothetical protein